MNWCHKEVRQGREITKAEAVTGPNNKVNCGLSNTTGGLPGPNNKEVKMGNQVVRRGLNTAVWCDCGNGWCNMISYKENNRRS